MLTQRQINKLTKAKKAGVGSDLYISKTQIRKVLKLGHGAPQLGSPMPMHRMAPRPNRTKKPTNTSSMKKDGGKLLSKKDMVSFRSPPIIGKWSDYDRFLQTGGLILPRATKKKANKTKKVSKPKFHKKIPTSNIDLINWCEYLNIPINSVLSRDETIPHGHKQSLFIYNLEPSYMSGSHWVATYVKDKVINYFDSFGMPPFQEIVNHAKKKNLTLLHQNNQIQSINSTTCGYFCLFFLNEMNKGNSYYDLIDVFNINNPLYNETFIEQYFKNI